MLDGQQFETRPGAATGGPLRARSAVGRLRQAESILRVAYAALAEGELADGTEPAHVADALQTAMDSIEQAIEPLRDRSEQPALYDVIGALQVIRVAAGTEVAISGEGIATSPMASALKFAADRLAAFAGSCESRSRRRRRD